MSHIAFAKIIKELEQKDHLNFFRRPDILDQIFLLEKLLVVGLVEGVEKDWRDQPEVRDLQRQVGLFRYEKTFCTFKK